MKKKRLNSCNVLDASPAERRLWHFVVERDEVKLGREQAVLPGTPIEPKLVQKDWRQLYQPKFNVAWVPASQVFLRVVQLPQVERPELLSMLEFQLEKLSPLPVAQVLWSVEVLPSRAEKMQTAIVCIAARDLVESFIGQIEGQNYQPDRLEVPQLNQILADGVREDGRWIYAGETDPDLCTVAWWSGGTLQQLQVLRLPPVAPLASGEAPVSLQQSRSDFLREQLMQTVWAGEMEGWLELPVKWHLVADSGSASFWQPLITPWAEEGVDVHPAFDRNGIARYSAARTVKGENAADLLPPGFAARYHQQYIDRLWMRGLGAVLGLYLIGVAIFLVALNINSFREGRVRREVAGIANTYTNVLRLKERVQVLQEQLNLKYAALDCWKAAAEQLPADFTLVNLVFNNGKTLQVYGTAPGDQREKVIEYAETLKKINANGQPLFRDVLPPNLTSRGSSNLSWNFDCHLNVSEAFE